MPGTDYRVLVVDGRAVAAAELHPAAVTGDGVSDIGQLVARPTPTRAGARATPAR